MYCIKCGKQIPDESNFCLNCGFSVKEQALKSIGTNLSPEYIRNFKVSSNGISDGSKNGYKLWFVLVDLDGNPTTAKGQLKVTVGHMTIIFFDKLYAVEVEDFHIGQNNQVGYLLEEKTPMIDRNVYLEFNVEFMMENGKKLKYSTHIYFR